jgi:hypothetical protein
VSGLGWKLLDWIRTTWGNSGGFDPDWCVDGLGCLRASGARLTTDLELVRTRGI